MTRPGELFHISLLRQCHEHLKELGPPPEAVRMNHDTLLSLKMGGYLEPVPGDPWASKWQGLSVIFDASAAEPKIEPQGKGHMPGPLWGAAPPPVPMR